ncbi:hypothetical protein NQZ68_016649 [Dissostichus eleginoides]|nr:hypothetical protein NQZ68_016649 [Dissostichus eleginoides]
MSGTGEDISQVHWKQQWLENGTLYFHVSMTESELLAQTTQPTAREPAPALHEHMHLLHISVMISLPLRFFPAHHLLIFYQKLGYIVLTYLVIPSPRTPSLFRYLPLFSMHTFSPSLRSTHLRVHLNPLTSAAHGPTSSSPTYNTLLV